MWVNGFGVFFFFPLLMVILTKKMTFLRSVQMSTRPMKRKEKKNPPVRHCATYFPSCFESNEATTETAAAKPIGCLVERAVPPRPHWKCGARTSSHASGLQPVSCRTEENGNKWFICTISTEKGAVRMKFFTWILIAWCTGDCNQLFSL